MCNDHTGTVVTEVPRRPGQPPNLGSLLKDRDPEAARRWYERAASGGDTAAIIALGKLLKDSDPDAAQR